MEVKDMTISDVLKTPEFYNNLKVVISDLENTREKCRNKRKRPIETAPDRPVCRKKEYLNRDK